MARSPDRGRKQQKGCISAQSYNVG